MAEGAAGAARVRDPQGPKVLHYAVRAKLLDENPASLVPNPEPKRVEIGTFTLDELEAVSEELSPRSEPCRCSRH